MEEEVKRWWKLAKDDLESAEANFKIEKYYVCAFLCQQAVEKALKAILIKRSQKLIRIHDLVILGRKTNIPNNLLKKCEQLSRAYIETRYGWLEDSVPSEKFTKQNSLEFLNIAKEILEWAEKNI